MVVEPLGALTVMVGLEATEGSVGLAIQSQ